MATAGADIVARMILQTGNVTSGVASMSSKLRAEAEGIAASNAKIGSSASKAAAEVNKSGMAANKMSYNYGTMFKGGEAAMGSFFNRMDTGTAKMSLMERATSRVNGVVGTLKSKVTGAASAIGNMDMMSSVMLAGAGLGILAFFSKATSAAADFEDQWTTFGITMGKTGSDTSAIMKEWDGTYQSIQTTTGRSQSDIMTGLDKLSIAGVKNTSLMTRSMDDLGGAAFQTHTNMDLVETAFQRNVQSTGLQQRSLKALGLNMADLSQVTGKTATDVTKDWKTMTAAQKAALLDSALEMKDGADANEKYKESYQGLLQSGKNALLGIEIAVGNTILPILVPALKTAAVWTKNLGQDFTKLPTPIKQTVVAAGLLTGGLFALGGMASLLKPIVGPIKAIGTALEWTYGKAIKAAEGLAEYVMEGRLASKIKGSSITETVNKITNNITHNTSDNTGGGGGGGSSWIQTGANIVTTAGAYLAGRGSSTIASIGARLGGVTLGGVARSAAIAGEGIPGIGEAIMGEFQPGQMFGRALTPFEQTASPYQQQQAELAADPQDYDSQGNYIGPNWINSLFSNSNPGPQGVMNLGKSAQGLGSWIGKSLSGMQNPAWVNQATSMTNKAGAYIGGALGNTGAYLGGALGNTGSAISGALGSAGSWLGNNLGFLRPGESPLQPVGAADGKPHSFMSDITASDGVLRGTGLESGGWINKGVSSFMKNPGGAISGALGGAGSAISSAVSGIKFPSAGDILKTIQSDLHIPDFTIPSAGDILKWIQTSLHIPNFKIPTLSQILSWIQSHIPKLDWKIPTMGSILSWIQDHIPKITWKIPSWNDIAKWIQGKLGWLKFPSISWNSIAGWVQGKLGWLHFPSISWNSIAGWIQSKIPWLHWPSGPGGFVSSMVGKARTIYNDYEKVKYAAEHPAQTVGKAVGGAVAYVGGAISNTGNYIKGAASNTVSYIKKLFGRGPGDISRARGDGDTNPLFPHGFSLTYQDYEGSKQNAITSAGLVGNCVDMSLGLIKMFGGHLVSGTWHGGPHVWANIPGIGDVDPARKALDNVWNPPAKGPDNESSRPIIVQNIFKGPVYGIPDFEDQVEDKTVKALNKHLGGIM